MDNSSQRLFAEDQTKQLSDEQQRYKAALYEKMNPRRRKFIDKIGYDNWDPYQEPKKPLDIRTDKSGRTLRQLMSEFQADHKNQQNSKAWQAGAADCALGIIQKDEKYQGIFDFCLWYARLLRKEGLL